MKKIKEWKNKYITPNTVHCDSHSVVFNIIVVVDSELGLGIYLF